MSQRLLPLEGGRNFRDMGGYAAEDGRRVRWGMLYRSGAMSELTAADREHLAGLGIAVICDFRTTGERRDEPTVWPGDAGPVIRFREYESNASTLRSAADADGPTEALMRAAMIGFYAELPYGHLESYQVMFGELLAGRAPMVINCSAGKDRTGVGAALLLAALGVGWDDILQDYSLSERLVDFEAVAMRAGASERTTGFASLAKMTKAARSPLLRSDPSYLDAMREAIEVREGSMSNYLASHLGVGPAETQVLRDMLLEAV